MQSLTYRNGNKMLVRLVPEPGAKFDYGFYGTGVAVCGPNDHFDPVLGEAIAAGRAFVDFGNMLEQTAEAQVITEARFFELIKQAYDERAAEGRQALTNAIFDATEEEQASFAAAVEEALDRGEQVLAEGPVNIVVDEERYDQLKAEHDAAVSAIKGESPVSQAALDEIRDLPPLEEFRIATHFENNLDDWKRAYSAVFDELRNHGVSEKRASLEASDAATALTLGS